MRRLNLRKAVAILCGVIAVAGVARYEVKLHRDDRNARNAVARADAAGRQVHELLVNQTTNRVKNVGTWCGAITDIEDVLVAYIALIPQAPPLHFHRLDCVALERGTAASTTR